MHGKTARTGLLQRDSQGKQYAIPDDKQNGREAWLARRQYHITDDQTPDRHRQNDEVPRAEQASTSIGGRICLVHKRLRIW